MIYAIYIKSHTEAPDFEQEIEASSKAEAIEMFYDMLEGEFSRDFIAQSMLDA